MNTRYRENILWNFLHRKALFTYEMIIAIIEDLLAVMEEMGLSLSPNQLLLDREVFFMEGGRYYFCYYPPNVKGIFREFP